MFSPNRSALNRSTVSVGFSFLLSFILAATLLPGTVFAQPVAEADIQIGTRGDGVLSTSRSIEATPGQNVVIEVFGANFEDSQGADMIFVLSDLTSYRSALDRRYSDGPFPEQFPLGQAVTTFEDTMTVIVLPEDLNAGISQGTDLVPIGGIRFTMAEGYTQFTARLIRVKYSTDALVEPDILFTITNPDAPQPPAAAFDLNPESGNQSQRVRRANPGQIVPVQVFASDLEGVTGFELQATVNPDQIDIERTGFAVNPLFHIVPPADDPVDPGTGGGPPSPGDGSALADLQIGARGDEEYTEDMRTIDAAPGQRVVLEVFGSDFTDSKGASMKFVLSDTTSYSSVLDRRFSDGPFPEQFPLGQAVSRFADTLTVIVLPEDLTVGVSQGPDRVMIGGARFTMAEGYTEFRLRLIRVKYSDADVVTPQIEFVIRNPNAGGDGGGTTGPLVKIDGNTVTAVAAADEPVSGDRLLGALQFRLRSSFRSGVIRINHLDVFRGDERTTLAEGVELGITPSVSAAPVAVKPPTPTTVTDTKAFIEGEFNRPGIVTVHYGTDPGDLNESVSSISAITRFRLLIEGLTPQTRYFFQVSSTAGQDVSDRFPPKPNHFATRNIDENPPRVVKGPTALGLTNESVDIVLETNEAAKATLLWGLSADDLPNEETGLSSFTLHLISLSDLDPGTEYFFKVRLEDLNGNVFETQQSRSFRTRSVVDTRPPRVLGRPTFNGGVVQWVTDEESNSAVFYSTDKDAIDRISAGPGPLAAAAKQDVVVPDSSVTEESVRQHRVGLVNLPSGTKMYYAARSTDASGNAGFSETFSFGTPATEDTKPPKLVRKPVVARVGDSGAVIVWGTHKPGTTIVQYAKTDAVYDDTTGLEGATLSVTDLTRGHEAILTDLESGTEYFAKIASVDINGVRPETEDGYYNVALRFVTRPGADTKSPSMIGLPVIVGITDNSAIVRWGADEIHSAVVRWGAVGEEPTGSVQDIDFGRRKSVTIPDLTPATTYQVEVQITDPAGNTSPAISNDQMVFTTKAGADSEAPRITRGPKVRNRRPTEVTIEWTTSEVADTRVSYGLTREYELTPYEVPEGTTDHVVILTDLEPSTRYHYAVGSADQSGNLVTTNAGGRIIGLSRDHRFRTKPEGSGLTGAPPKIIEGPTVEFTDTRAKVKWRTNRPATSKVVLGLDPNSAAAGEDGAVVYGELSQIVVEENDPVTRHGIDIAGLDPGIDYFYQVTSVNDFGEDTSADPLAATKFAPPGGFGSFTTDTNADTQFPVITSGPTVVSATKSTMQIEWETDESANSVVNFGTDESSLGDDETQGSTKTKHKVVLTKLAAGTTYAYKVASTDVSGNGATESAVAFGTTNSENDIAAPSITLLNSADNPSEPIYKTDRSATIYWETNEVSDAKVLYGTAADNLDQDLTDSEFDDEHSLTLTNLEANTEYFFQVESLDQSNNGPTVSDVLSFTTEDGQDTVDPVIDATSISTIVTDSIAIIGWVTDEISDSAIRYGVSGGSLDLVAGDASNVTLHVVTLTNLEPSTTYAYVVESTDPSDNSAESAQLEFTTASGEVVAPTAPATVTAQAGNGAVLVTWDASAADNVVGYTVQRSEDGGDFASVASLEKVLAYVDANATNGTAYSYQVAAVGPQQSTGDFSTATEAVTPEETSGHSTPLLFITQGDPFQPTFGVVNSVPVSGNTLSYTFHISTSADFDDAVVLESGVEQGSGIGPDDPQDLTAWTVPDSLELDTTYHYRIVASDGVFDSPPLTGTYEVDPDQIPFAGDLDGDGDVGFQDFLVVAGLFGKTSDDPDFRPEVDFNGDGVISFPDFLEFVGKFGNKYLKGPESSKPVLPLLAYGTDNASRLSLARQSGGTAMGQTVVVRMDASDAENLKAYGVRISYDPEALSFIDAEDGEETLLSLGGDDAGLFAVVSHDEKKGEVVLGAATSGATAEGSGPLAYLNFQILTDHPSGDVLGIEEGIFIDGKFNANSIENLGGRFTLVPEAFVLEPNYPNPFNPETTINYAVPEAGKISIRIYNVLGQEILTLAEGDHLPGLYTVRWDGQDRFGRTVASGIYLYRMESAGFSQVHKMLLLK